MDENDASRQRSVTESSQDPEAKVRLTLILHDFEVHKSLNWDARYPWLVCNIMGTTVCTHTTQLEAFVCAHDNKCCRFVTRGGR